MMIAANFRQFFEALLNPFFISILLLSISIAWLWVHGDSRAVRGCLLLSIIGIYLFSTGWLPGTLISVFENKYPVVTKVEPGIHWIVVLGGGHYPELQGVPANDELSSASIERLVEAVRLYRQLPMAKLLLSGGTEIKGTRTDAAYLAIVASWFDISENDIVLETDSINTVDEVLAIKKMIHNAPFYLVTSAIHMSRAMAFCRQQGLNPTPAPTSHTYYWKSTKWHKIAFPNHVNLAHTSTVWHEILGLVWAKIRGIL